jgi:hypothetical protein
MGAIDPPTISLLFALKKKMNDLVVSHRQKHDGMS